MRGRVLPWGASVTSVAGRVVGSFVGGYALCYVLLSVVLAGSYGTLLVWHQTAAALGARHVSVAW